MSKLNPRSSLSLHPGLHPIRGLLVAYWPPTLLHAHAATGITLLKLTSDLDTLEKTTAGQISFLDEAAGSGVGVPNSVRFYK